MTLTQRPKTPGPEKVSDSENESEIIKQVVANNKIFRLAFEEVDFLSKV